MNDLELRFLLHADYSSYTPTMRKFVPILSRVLILILASSAGSAFAQNDPEWTEPFPPFRIAGNLHYVGSKEAGGPGQQPLSETLSTQPTRRLLSHGPHGFVDCRGDLGLAGFSMLSLDVVVGPVGTALCTAEVKSGNFEASKPTAMLFSAFSS
jgi:hypothetical protein